MTYGYLLFYCLSCRDKISPCRTRFSIKKEKLPVLERLNQYQAAFVMNLALLEGPALLCLILHFLNGDPLLFYTCIFMIIMLALARPTEEKVMRELGLRSEDIQ